MPEAPEAIDPTPAPRPRRWQRRAFLAAGASALFGVGGFGWMRFIEPWWFRVRRVPIAIGLPRPLRVLHLSDFHASEDVAFELIERGLRLGLELEPDLICLTGDYVTSTIPDPIRYRSILAQLPATAPTYASLGNHDGGPWSRGTAHGYPSDAPVRELLADAGITVLKQEARSLERYGLRLVGLGDHWNSELEPEPLLRRNEASDMDGLKTILLGHNPDGKSLLDGYDWQLLLCGHTHGGQLWIPLGGGAPFAPVIDHTMIAGLYPWRDRYQIHITPGIGNLHGMRLNCRPEVSLLELS